MRMILTLALAATLAAPVAAQRDSLSREDRRRLETRLQQLQSELRDLERQLGSANRLFVRSADREPFVWRVVTANRARLGVIVNTEPAETDAQGARLQAVTPNGPAADAGLRAGDVLTRVNGVSLANARPNPGQRLIEEVDSLDDGDTVRVEYRRGNANDRATILARVMDDLTVSPRSPMGVGGWDSLAATARLRLDSAGGVLGRALMEVREMPGFRASLFTNRWSSMELTTLDAGLGSYFGTTEGVLVVRAPSDSLLGLRSGDVIQRIGGRVPTSPSHALRILRSYEPGDRVELDVMRERRAQRLNAVVPQN
ncbi:MAG: PDZ domain-containing protein [Gemmatimonadales bacterium]